MKVQKWIKE